MHALIIEDEALIALLMADQLETAGWTATIVEGGTKALDALASEHFDLAIVDLGLPGDRGSDLIRSMQKMAPGMRFIVCTGYAFDSAVARCVPAGVPVLEKPCPEVEFLKAVCTTMAGTDTRSRRPAREMSH